MSEQVEDHSDRGLYQHLRRRAHTDQHQGSATSSSVLSTGALQSQTGGSSASNGDGPAASSGSTVAAQAPNDEEDRQAGGEGRSRGAFATNKVDDGGADGQEPETGNGSETVLAAPNEEAGLQHEAGGAEEDDDNRDVKRASENRGKDETSAGVDHEKAAEVQPDQSAAARTTSELEERGEKPQDDKSASADDGEEPEDEDEQGNEDVDDVPPGGREPESHTQDEDAASDGEDGGLAMAMAASAVDTNPESPANTGPQMVSYLQNVPKKYDACCTVNLLLANDIMLKDEEFQKLTWEAVRADPEVFPPGCPDLDEEAVERMYKDWADKVVAGVVAAHTQEMRKAEYRKKRFYYYHRRYLEEELRKGLVFGAWSIPAPAGREEGGDLIIPYKVLSPNLHPSIRRVLSFFTVPRSKTARKNLGYSFLCFRTGALRDRYNELMRGCRLVCTSSKVLQIYDGRMRNLAALEAYFSRAGMSDFERWHSANVFWLNRSPEEIARTLDVNITSWRRDAHSSEEDRRGGDGKSGREGRSGGKGGGNRGGPSGGFPAQRRGQERRWLRSGDDGSSWRGGGQRRAFRDGDRENDRDYNYRSGGPSYDNNRSRGSPSGGRMNDQRRDGGGSQYNNMGPPRSGGGAPYHQDPRSPPPYNQGSRGYDPPGAPHQHPSSRYSTDREQGPNYSRGQRGQHDQYDPYNMVQQHARTRDGRDDQYPTPRGSPASYGGYYQDSSRGSGGPRDRPPRGSGYPNSGGHGGPSPISYADGRYQADGSNETGARSASSRGPPRGRGNDGPLEQGQPLSSHDYGYNEDHYGRRGPIDRYNDQGGYNQGGPAPPSQRGGARGGQPYRDGRMQEGDRGYQNNHSSSSRGGAALQQHNSIPHPRAEYNHRNYNVDGAGRGDGVQDASAGQHIFSPRDQQDSSRRGSYPRSGYTTSSGGAVPASRNYQSHPGSSVVDPRAGRHDAQQRLQARATGADRGFGAPRGAGVRGKPSGSRSGGAGGYPGSNEQAHRFAPPETSAPQSGMLSDNPDSYEQYQDHQYQQRVAGRGHGHEAGSYHPRGNNVNDTGCYPSSGNRSHQINYAALSNNYNGHTGATPGAIGRPGYASPDGGEYGAAPRRDQQGAYRSGGSSSDNADGGSRHQMKGGQQYPRGGARAGRGAGGASMQGYNPSQRGGGLESGFGERRQNNAYNSAGGQFRQQQAYQADRYNSHGSPDQYPVGGIIDSSRGGGSYSSGSHQDSRRDSRRGVGPETRFGPQHRGGAHNNIHQSGVAMDGAPGVVPKGKEPLTPVSQSSEHPFKGLRPLEDGEVSPLAVAGGAATYSGFLRKPGGTSPSKQVEAGGRSSGKSPSRRVSGGSVSKSAGAGSSTLWTLNNSTATASSSGDASMGLGPASSLGSMGGPGGETRTMEQQGPGGGPAQQAQNDWEGHHAGGTMQRQGTNAQRNIKSYSGGSPDQNRFGSEESRGGRST
ncbi:unnamed protein product [Amoebophrya sp. A25]|nr:unnamed protein product [Amoebophrya sp. A25]|eukprot:GSA25T00000858001.1